MTVPTQSLAAAAVSYDRLLVTLDRMRPEQVFQPSALPGWTRGHVLAHLSRNADALCNLLRGARTGQPVPMYPTPETRDRDIEDGAKRSLDEQVADLRAATRRFVEATGSMPAEAWAVEVPHRTGPFPAERVPAKRVGEIEYHHVDLALDYTPAQWPEDFVAQELGPLLHRHVASGAITAGLRQELQAAPDHAVLAWLSGRSDGADLGVPASSLPSLPPLS
jgi:maleylpyruvate isomerase